MIVSNKITGSVVYNILKNVLTRDKHRATVLGRWGAHTTKQNDLKIDYSNEDHCGTCSQYVQGKIQSTNDTLRYEFESLNINSQSQKY